MSGVETGAGSGNPAGNDTATARGGVAVHLRGIIHLYEQDGPDIVALRGVDLDIDAGEMVALLGPSGMGKSTLLQLLAGMMRPSSGEIRVGEVDLRRLGAPDLQRLRATEVSYLLQDPTENLLPYATAVQNVWFAQQAGRRLAGHVLPDPHQHLAALGLGDVADRRVVELSRGMQQQIALAAAVGNAPRLLLADEPTNQLDSQASAAVVTLLQTINAELGTTVVLVTHDPAVAESLARTITIRDGRIGAEGRLGTQYAVVDGSGSLQLPPEILEHFPPQTRLIVDRLEDGIVLRPAREDQ